MSGSPRCKHARLVGREVVKLSASVSLQVCVESDTTVKISPHLPRIYQQFLPDQDSAPKFAARTARRETRHAWTMGNKKCEHGRRRYGCMRDAAVDDDVTWTPGGATLILNSIPHSDTRRLDHVRAQRHADPSVDGAGRARQHRASMLRRAHARSVIDPSGAARARLRQQRTPWPAPTGPPGAGGKLPPRSSSVF